MSRSTWKLQYINQSYLRTNFKKLLLDTLKQEKNSKNGIKIWDRSSAIIKLYLGKIVQIYNGKTFVFRRIRSNKMFGGKFGELSRCTKRARKTIVDKKSFKKDNKFVKNLIKRAGYVKKQFINKYKFNKKLKFK